MSRSALGLEYLASGRSKSSKLLAALAFCVLQILTGVAYAAGALSSSEFEAELAQGLDRVPELRFLRAEAEKLGVEAHLFGGTAASFAHYVKDDVLRRRGEGNYQADRFDYEFTSIFRSTQDLDVVVDGPREKIDELTRILQQRYPHFLGDKGMKWELRSLREAKGRPGDHGYKEALLGNPDFLMQNTDSHSTGLIRVTRPQSGDTVRDLRDWKSRVSKFETDVLEGKLHYYSSAQHYQSPRAKLGENPEIFSVVRALTKAFQYDLFVDSKTLGEFRAIVGRTDWKAFANETPVRRRFLDMAKKLFLHAVDVERAWNVVEALGLRKKLGSLDDPKEADSLARLMGREPLRSAPLGTGPGRTAAEIATELGVEKLVVSHETSSFLAWESIMRSRLGEPNFFVSRPDAPGEMALFGWGVYTKFGRSGAAGTGITVRLELDPRAREGTDFVFVPKEGYFLLRNKNAARTIDEPIRLSLVDYIGWVAKAGTKDDLALMEAFRRKIKHNPVELNDLDREKIRKYVTSSRPGREVVYELRQLGMTDLYSLDEMIRLNAGSSGVSIFLRATLEEIGKLPAGERERAFQKLRELGTVSTLYELSDFVKEAKGVGLGDAFTPLEKRLAEIGSKGYMTRARTMVYQLSDEVLRRTFREAMRQVGTIPSVEMIAEIVRGFVDTFGGASLRTEDRELIKRAVEEMASRPLTQLQIDLIRSEVTTMVDYAWARPVIWDALLRHARTADQFLQVLEPRARKLQDERGKTRFDWSDYYSMTHELWVKHYDKFLSLRPTAEQAAQIPERVRVRPVKASSCEALF